MLNPEDAIIWEELKKTVSCGQFGKKKEELPPRLKVHCSQKTPLPFCLDLHKMTLEEAYQETLSFIKKHYQLGTKKVQVITGKGREGKGLIRGEFTGWLETSKFKKYIREANWTNDGGAVEIWLRKNK